MTGGYTLSTTSTEELAYITVDHITMMFITTITAVIFSITNPASMDTQTIDTTVLLKIYRKLGKDDEQKDFTYNADWPNHVSIHKIVIG